MKLTALLVDIGDVIAFYDGESFPRYIVSNGGSLEKDREYFRKHKGSYDAGTLSDVAFWKGYVEYTGVRCTPADVKRKIRESFRIDQRVLDVLAKLRATGVKVIIASNIDENTLVGLRERIDFARLFDAAYFSCELRVVKRDPEFFRRIIVEQRLAPATTLFIDDLEKNLASARSLGIQTHHYTGYESFEKRVDDILTRP